MRQLCYIYALLLLFSSCKEKVICSAYQSAYILDDSIRTNYYSYAWYLDEEERASYLASKLKSPQPTDTLDTLGTMVASAKGGEGADYWEWTAKYKRTPRDRRRTKYGIVKNWPLISNFVRNQRLKTAPWENVLTPPNYTKPEKTPPPAFQTFQSDSLLAESDSLLVPLDSTATIVQTDSVENDTTTNVATLVKEEDENPISFKYGFDHTRPMQPDQEYYFRKYGWLLQSTLPPPTPTNNKSIASSEPDSLHADTTKRAVIKGLFGGKKRAKRQTEKRAKEPRQIQGRDTRRFR